MPEFVVMGATMQCTFGVAPAVLNVIRPTVLIGGKPAATIMDFAPIANIPTFGMCSAPSNPAVIAATSAALGVFTPAPCVPNTVAPWMPPNTKVLIQNQPALMSNCKCMCLWGGSISVTFAGQMTVSG